MGDGTKENPYTREDVEKAIKENGGTAKGLDLSGKVFKENINLSNKVLYGIKLNDTILIHANFNGAELDEAEMKMANLRYSTFNPFEGKTASLLKVDFRGAYLKNAEFRLAEVCGAQFQKHPEKLICATLEEADFRDANLFGANFKGCKFYRTKLEGACIESADITLKGTLLGDADWGDSYVIGEEKKSKFDIAEHRYRQLKAWYTNAGYEHIASKFHYREIEARRKNLRLFSRNFLHRIALQLSYWVFGHGEGWKRILLWMAGVISIFALIYFLIGTLSPNSFLNSLYYSAVSFTALGYGNWAPQPAGWVKWLGAFEAIVGVSMMALLLVTFVRKWTR